jgi:hypothetical protein
LSTNSSGKPVPTFPDRASGNKKAPDLHQAGLRFQMMRSSSYARTPPEAPEGFLVVVVRLVAVIMVDELMRESFDGVNAPEAENRGRRG